MGMYFFWMHFLDWKYTSTNANYGCFKDGIHRDSVIHCSVAFKKDFNSLNSWILQYHESEISSGHIWSHLFSEKDGPLFEERMASYDSGEDMFCCSWRAYKTWWGASNHTFGALDVLSTHIPGCVYSRRFPSLDRLFTASLLWFYRREVLCANKKCCTSAFRTLIRTSL